MENAGYFFAAFAVIWVLFFGYLLSLFRRQGRLRQEIEAVEKTLQKGVPDNQ